MKSLESNKSKVTKNENGKNVSHLEITNVVLVYINIVNNGYQEDSRVLYTFIPNTSFRQLFDISPKKIYIFKTSKFARQ